MLDNFSIASKDTELGAMVVVLATHPSNSRHIDAIQGNNSTSIAICFNKGKSMDPGLKGWELLVH